MQPDRRNAIAARFVPLIEPIARMLAGALPPSFDVRELVQIGHVALLEAADRHDANPEAFPAYLKFRLRGAMLDFVRKNYPVAAEPEADLVAGDGKEPTTPEAIAVRQAVDRLPEQERKVTVLSFREERSQREIAHRLDLSQTRVSQLQRAAIAHLRLMLAA